MKEIERIIRLNESEDTLSLPAQAACQGGGGGLLPQGLPAGV